MKWHGIDIKPYAFRKLIICHSYAQYQVKYALYMPYLWDQVRSMSARASTVYIRPWNQLGSHEDIYIYIDAVLDTTARVNWITNAIDFVRKLSSASTAPSHDPINDIIQDAIHDLHVLAYMAAFHPPYGRCPNSWITVPSTWMQCLMIPYKSFLA